MSDEAARREAPETVSFEGHVDRLCERFEAAWKAGKPPQIDDYLELDSPSEGAPSLRELLVELVKVDLDYRWRFGSRRVSEQETPKAPASLPERPRVEEYVAQYPALGPLEELPEELIVAEYCARHRWGDKPSHNEYLTRFGTQRTGLLEMLSRTDEALALRKKERPSDREAAPSLGEPPGGLHVRCPHCRNPIEIVDDTPLAEIACPSCGSSFNLVGEEALTLQTLGGTRRRRRTIGHFELLEQLGSGAFGAVWKARDTQLDRIVAIKTPRKGQLDREETEKVLREARAAAQLRHPNIVSVHEVGLDGELIYTVSDFIEGVSLHDWLTGQKFTYREAAELCAKIAEAIHFAHEQGVIHRDLKPSNIMLDPSGEPHLTDFGLAKREAGEITMTVDGQILGTPAYMSPEQAKGEGHAADRRTDVYSLGVILFELLTGECPFRGNMRMLLKQVIDDEPPSPRKLDNQIPRDLETICLKCLEKDRTRRYGSGKEVSDELRRHLRGEGICARPISRLARTWRWCKRKPLVASLVGTVAALLLFLAVAGPMVALEQASLRQLADERAGEAENARREATDRAVAEADARKEAEEARNRAELLHRRAESNSYFKLTRLAHREWFANNVVEAERILDGFPRQIRHWEWDYLKRLCHTELMTLRGHAAAINDVAYTPDGRCIASASEDNTVRIWDCSSGQEKFVLQGHSKFVGVSPFVWDRRRGVTKVEFSSIDGKRILSGGQEHRVVLGWETLNGTTGNAWQATDQTVIVWETLSGQKLRSFSVQRSLSPGSKVDAWKVKLNPNGRQVALLAWKRHTLSLTDYQLSLRDVETGRQILNIGGCVRVSFSADGKRLHTTITPFRQWKGIWGGGRIRSGDIIWSLNGKRIPVASLDPIIKLWDTATGEEIPSAGAETEVIADSNGNQQATMDSDGIVHVGNTGSSVELRGLARPFELSPDGQRIASGSSDGTVKIWDATVAQEATVRVLGGRTEDLSALALRLSGILDTGIIDTGIIDSIIDSNRIYFRGDDVSAVALSPKHVVSALFGGTLRVSDLCTGEPLHTMTVPRPKRPKGRQQVRLPPPYSPGGLFQGGGSDSDTYCAIIAIALSWDGTRIAAADLGRVRLWDGVTGLPLHDFFVTRDPWGEWRREQWRHSMVERLAMTPDGTRLAAATFVGAVRVWDTTNGKELLSLSEDESREVRDELGVVGSAPRGGSLAFSHDGGWIAVVCHHMVKIRDASTGEEIRTLKGHTMAVLSVAFSPNGKHLASASVDKTVKVWNPATGQEMFTLRGHLGEVRSVTFSPDGMRIVSASRDKTVKLWDAATGQEVLTLKGDSEDVHSVAFSHEGKRIALASGNTVKIWDGTRREATNGGDPTNSPDHPQRKTGVSRKGHTPVPPPNQKPAVPEALPPSSPPPEKLLPVPPGPVPG